MGKIWFEMLVDWENFKRKKGWYTAGGLESCDAGAGPSHHQHHSSSSPRSCSSSSSSWESCRERVLSVQWTSRVLLVFWEQQQQQPLFNKGGAGGGFSLEGVFGFQSPYWTQLTFSYWWCYSPKVGLVYGLLHFLPHLTVPFLRALP